MKPKLLVCRPGVVPYHEALEIQNQLRRRRADGLVHDVLLLLAHPPVFTLGRSGRAEHLLVSRPDIELVRTNRGGDITYHGPGQAVGYLILDLTELYMDLRRLFRDIEAAIIDALGTFGISAGHDERYTGVWVGRDKIAAIGLGVRRWVTMHGFALNVSGDLAPFDAIVPCGLTDRGVTSMQRLGCDASMEQVYAALADAFARRLGYTLSSARVDDLLQTAFEAS
ncbi:MAG TPA: lipoyl(octanoyl) transferase LipB [Phycisphaerae bacterium]|nr:lipoyl(octanoyl) transferase LipB [Phycisphaerae bacterium]